MTDKLNLSGIWHGQYNYPRAFPPVSFQAQITDAASQLSGIIWEIAQRGVNRGTELEATIHGSRSGKEITFLKLYQDNDKIYDNVCYSGGVHEDGTEISGEWTIPGNWSGTFLMIRRITKTERKSENSELIHNQSSEGRSSFS